MRLTAYNAIDIEHALQQAATRPAFPPADDRAYWSAVRKTLGEEERAAWLRRAEADASADIPALPATLYLEYARTGRREGYQDPMFRRRQMLANLAVAEILEGTGRFLDPLLNVAWAICEEASWAMPAHQTTLADPQHPVVDLGAAMTALSLAELVPVLGGQLDPALSRLIRHEVDRRCVTPYLNRHDHWWLHNSHVKSVNNWTAVCNAGVAGAAIHLEPDTARLAEILARAARSMDDYLDTFGSDGGSSEGPGYWSYGFGYYTLLAHLVEGRTGGRISFLDSDRLRAISQYPIRTQLSPRRYVAFSDCDPDVSFVRAHLAYLGTRFELGELAALAAEQAPDTRSSELVWALRELAWRVPPDTPTPAVPAPHDWLDDLTWMIARVDPADPNALVVAAKGGHNDEMHNQNDVGGFLVHLGGESVIAELGRGRYTKAYFGARRYDHFVNSSRGHSVPVPNGYEQHPGPDFAATLLDHQADGAHDLVQFDLAGAYPAAAGLETLVRTLQLHRDGSAGWVEVSDRARFTEPGLLDSVLVTLGSATVSHSEVVLQGARAALRVRFDPAHVSAQVEVTTGVEFPEATVDVQRVVFSLVTPTTHGTIGLQIEPC